MILRSLWIDQFSMILDIIRIEMLSIGILQESIDSRQSAIQFRMDKFAIETIFLTVSDLALNAVYKEI